MTISFDGFDVAALLVFVILIATAFVLIVLIGSLPGRIARARGHPQADAVTAAGWVGIASLGLLWPIAFIWAFMKPSPSASPIGAGATGPREPLADSVGPLQKVHNRIETLEAGLRTLQSQKGEAQ